MAGLTPEQLGLLGVGLVLGLIGGAVTAFFLLNSGSTSTPIPVLQNEEKWQWVDYKGRQREIVVHRNVSSG